LPRDKVKILVVGGGSGGLAVANQIYNRFKAEGKQLAGGDIQILDAAEFHYYQPGWTLVGAGLKKKTSTRKRLAEIVPSHLSLRSENVATFAPESSSVTTTSGNKIDYEILVVSAGLQINWGNIQGLTQALADPNSGVSSIYGYDTCDKVWDDIEAIRTGKALFTQPAGVIKCAGAPQKIMWMAWDRFQRTKRGSNIKVEFWNGMPTMFSVPKYSEALNKIREERKVRGEFQHNLIAIDTSNRIAVFAKPDGTKVETGYTTLHVTPPMGPLDFIKKSPIADGTGWVDVNQSSLRHNKKEFRNVFSLGDCSSLPTSKTAAAITAQAPVLAENVYSVMNSGEVNPAAIYDGYTSCPLLTGYGQLMLAEFKYGLQPKETFSSLFNQAKPNRLFYHLKKDFFPVIYNSRMINGTWFGPHGVTAPSFKNTTA